MPGGVRRRAERVGLAVIASLGIVVLIADMLGWLDRLASTDAIPKITLLVLSTVTIFLLMEVERFQTLDNIDARLAELDIEGIAKRLKDDRYAGLIGVHPRFAEGVFTGYVESAQEITILNTWIPNLDALKDALQAALARGATVRILLLNPNSDVADLRNEALAARGVGELDDNVKDGITRCVRTFARMREQLGADRAAGLLFNSLPSVSVYRADEHYLVSVFLHRQLAIHSPQFELDGTGSLLATQVQRELNILWDIGDIVDLSDPRALDLIRG
jgi:hypothetical protein